MQSKAWEVILCINSLKTCEKTQKEIVIIRFEEKVPMKKLNNKMMNHVASSSCNFQKIQNPSRYHNSIITNLKFQHKPGKISSFKNPHIKKI